MDKHVTGEKVVQPNLKRRFIETESASTSRQVNHSTPDVIDSLHKLDIQSLRDAEKSSISKSDPGSCNNILFQDLEDAAEKGSLKSFKDLLEIPEETESSTITLNSKQHDMLSYVSSDNLTLLMIAAKTGNTVIVEFLLKCGLDVNFKNNFFQTAADIAWEYEKYDTVLKLVRADSPFPEKFCVNELKSLIKWRFDVFLRSHVALHEHIRENKLVDNNDEIVKYVEDNPALKFVYDESNQCALTTALKVRNFEIYAFLRSKGFAIGIDCSHDQIIMSLTEHEKKSLDEHVQNYFQSLDTYIMDLLSKSHLGLNNDTSNFGKIQEFFEALNEIRGLQKILQIVAMDQRLSIIFDFNRDSIRDLDVTKCFDDDIQGRSYPTLSKILIAAQRDEADILGTLAHELAHHAIHIVYDNNWRPYYRHGQVSEKKFLKIVEICKKSASKHEVIGRVFTGYKEKRFAAELIVRVPQLLALLAQEQEKLEQAEKDFKELFEFYEEQVLTCFDREVPLMEPRRKLQYFNKLLGEFSKSKNSKISSTQQKINFNEIETDANIFMWSLLPELTLNNLIKHSHENINSQSLFVKLEHLLDKKIFDEVQEFLVSVLKPKLIILDTINIDIDNAQIILNQLENENRIVLISSRTELASNFSHKLEITFKWEDLTEDAKDEVLKSKIVFQDAEVVLNEILQINSKLLQDFALHELFKVSHLNFKGFDKLLIEKPKIFIQRTFKTNSEEYLLTEDVFNSMNEEKAIILADSAGMGKTTTAVNFARDLKSLNPFSWIVFVDLKKHTSIYKLDLQEQPETLNSDFFSRDLLQLKSNFEQKLFEHFYESKKVIFIVDGFDEVSPSYTEFVLKILTAVQHSQNCFIVTTRVHMKKKLEKKFKTKAFELMPYSYEDQVYFLTEAWRKSPNDFDVVMKVESLLQKLVGTQFRIGRIGLDFFEVPLQLVMFAEVFESADVDPETLDLSSLYKKFVKKKIELWNKKGVLASEDNTSLIMNSIAVVELHQKIALDKVLGQKFMTSDELKKEMIESLWLPEITEDVNMELICRLGLLRVDQNGEFEFVHRTFAEYLIADLIFKNVTTKTRLSSSNSLNQIFLQVLIGNRTYEQILKFLEDMAQWYNGTEHNSKDKIATEILAKNIEESLNVEDNRELLSSIVSYASLTTFFLATLQLTSTSKLQLLMHNKTVNGNPLHRAQDFGNETFKHLWTLIEGFAAKNEQIEVLIIENKEGKNVFCYAISKSSKNIETFDFLLEFILNTATSKQFLSLLVCQEDENHFKHDFKRTALGSAKHCTDHPILEILWDKVAKKLDHDEFKAFLFHPTQPYDAGVFGSLSHHANVLSTAIKNIKERLNQVEFSEIFCFTKLLNVLVYFVRDAKSECFKIFWKFVQDSFNEIDKKLFFIKRVEIESILSVLYQNEDKFTVEFVLEIAKGFFEPEEFMQVMLGIEGNEISVLNLVFKFGRFDQIPNDERQSGLNLGKTDIQKSLLEKDSKDEKAFYCLCIMNHHTQLSSVEQTWGFVQVKDCWDLIFDNLNSSEIKNLFSKRNMHGNNALYYAAKHENPVLMTFLEIAKTSPDENALKRLFFDRNANDETLVHCIARYCGNKYFIQNFINFVSTSLPEAEIREMLRCTEYLRQIPLQHSLKCKNDENLIEIIWNFYFQTFGYNGLSEVLFNDSRYIFFTKLHDFLSPNLNKLTQMAVECFGEADVQEKIEREKLKLPKIERSCFDIN